MSQCDSVMSTFRILFLHQTHGFPYFVSSHRLFAYHVNFHHQFTSNQFKGNQNNSFYQSHYNYCMLTLLLSFFCNFRLIGKKNSLSFSIHIKNGITKIKWSKLWIYKEIEKIRRFMFELQLNMIMWPIDSWQHRIFSTCVIKNQKFIVYHSIVGYVPPSSSARCNLRFWFVIVFFSLFPVHKQHKRK